jgi:hypothetical protein
MIQSKNVFVVEVVWKNNQRSVSTVQDRSGCVFSLMLFLYQQGRAECEKFTLFPSSGQTCLNQMLLNIAQNLSAVESSIEFFK